jgi:Domain of unknown function (DUF397)
MTIEAVPCSREGCVDLRDARYPNDGVLHLTPADWAEFLVAVKRGDFDVLSKSDEPPELHCQPDT